MATRDSFTELFLRACLGTILLGQATVALSQAPIIQPGAPGDSVRFAVFNWSRRPTTGRFGLLDAVSGDSVAGSMSGTMTVASRKGVVFDVVIPSEFPADGEILGVFLGWKAEEGEKSSLRGSFQVRDEEGRTTAFMSMSEMTGSFESGNTTF